MNEEAVLQSANFGHDKCDDHELPRLWILSGQTTTGRVARSTTEGSSMSTDFNSDTAVTLRAGLPMILLVPSARRYQWFLGLHWPHVERGPVHPG